MTSQRENAWRRALTRRAAIGTMGAALGSVATTRLAAAQDSTPAAEDASTIFTMFVQTAQAGTCVPVPDRPGVYEVSLAGVAGQTIYFSDRPERIVGTVPTETFLATLGFQPDNPPNAAIVAETAEGQDVLVVALQAPRWDEDAQLLTYEMEILERYDGQGLAHLAREQDDSELPAAFGHTSLFIDDCPDITDCWNGSRRVGTLPVPALGSCWGWSPFGCNPCDGRPREYYQGLCNDAYAECKNICDIQPEPTIIMNGPGSFDRL